MARRGFEVRVALVCRADGRVFDPNRDRARYGFEYGTFILVI